MNLSSPLAQLEQIARRLASKPTPEIDQAALIQITYALSALTTAAKQMEQQIQELQSRVR